MKSDNSSKNYYDSVSFDAPITLADLHYLTPIEFEKWAKRLDMRLSWQTFDFDWAHGDRLICDFEHRLPNVF